MTSHTPSYAQGLQDAWEAVNVLGGWASTDAERDYCRAIEDVLNSIEALQASQSAQVLIGRLEAMLADLRKPHNGFVAPKEANSLENVFGLTKPDFLNEILSHE